MKPQRLSDSHTRVIPFVICIIIVLAIICIWLIVYQCRPEPYINTITITGDVDDPIIELSGKTSSKNILQKMFSSKISFKITSKGGSYTVDVPSYYDYNFRGKGLVIAANGNKYRYLTGLYTNLYVIRHLHRSTIPIEIFYVGKQEEFPSKVHKLLLDLGNISIINLLDRIDTNVLESELRGYQTKPLAALCSSFDEVIVMDADALSFMDPFMFFSCEGYLSQGMVLFRDYVDCLNFINKSFINDIGIGAESYCNKTQGYEIDSSCVILNKRKYWDALFTICIINVKSDVYYKHKKNVLGDKDTWLIGPMFLGMEPFISIPKPAVLVTDLGQQVLGHMQRINFSSSISTPMYYNNQMVDLATADVSKWTYKVEKNPQKSSNTEPGYPLTNSMIESFEMAKKAMIILGPNIPSFLKKKLDSKNGVSQGFIP